MGVTPWPRPRAVPRRVDIFRRQNQSHDATTLGEKGDQSSSTSWDRLTLEMSGKMLDRLGFRWLY